MASITESSGRKRNNLKQLTTENNATSHSTCMASVKMFSDAKQSSSNSAWKSLCTMMDYYGNSCLCTVLMHCGLNERNDG